MCRVCNAEDAAILARQRPAARTRGEELASESSNQLKENRKGKTMVNISMAVKVITMVVMLADLLFCIMVGLRSKDNIENADDYFIAGKNTGTFLLTMTAFASLLGAGLFLGQAGRGYAQGISAYWQLFGEGIVAGIFMALIIGPFLAKFSYYSMAHFIGEYVCGGNTTIRRIAGVANFLPNMLWAGGQIMGISYVVQLLFGIDFRIVAIVCGAVFIFYTTCGGVSSVIITDALHGSIAVVTCVLIAIFGIGLLNRDFGGLEGLKTAVIALAPEKWDMNQLTPIQIATAFLTGFLGTLANPIYWNRAFTSKDASTCRKAYAFAFSVGTIIPLFTILMGVMTFVYNQDLADYALLWTIMNKMPAFMTVLTALSVLAATLSSADTHLNCAAANIVTDVIDPEGKLSTEQTIKYSRYATIFCGIISVLVSMYAEMIYDLANFGYTVCGGVLIPLFAMGVFMKDRTKEEHVSSLTATGAILGMVCGMIAAILFQAVPSLSAVMGGGIIPGVIATVIATLIGNAVSSGK